MSIDPLRLLRARASSLQLPSRQLLRSGALIVVGNLLTILFRVAALRIFTHLMSAGAYGAANLVLGILALGFQLLIQPVASTQLRYHTGASRAGRGDAFTVQALRWTLAAAAVVAVLCVLGFALWPFETGASVGTGMMAAIVFWIVGNASKTVFAARLHAEQRISIYVWLRVAEAGLIAVITSLALLVYPRAEAFVWSQAVTFVAVILATSFVAPWPTLSAFTRVGERDSGTPPFRANLWRYGGPFLPMAGLTWLANMGDRYVLAAVLGAGATGQYLAAFTIASTGFILANGAMSDLFRPKLFDAETTGAHGHANRIFAAWLAAYTAISLCGLAAIALLGRWIAWLLLAEPYRAHAVEIMLWVGLGYSLAGLTQALTSACSRSGARPGWSCQSRSAPAPTWASAIFSSR